MVLLRVLNLREILPWAILEGTTLKVMTLTRHAEEIDHGALFSYKGMN
jgi:hypothetical protein